MFARGNCGLLGESMTASGLGLHSSLEEEEEEDHLDQM